MFHLKIASSLVSFVVCLFHRDFGRLGAYLTVFVLAGYVCLLGCMLCVFLPLFACFSLMFLSDLVVFGLVFRRLLQHLAIHTLCCIGNW